MTLPPDPFDPTEPGASRGHAFGAAQGSLATLSRRGHERGAMTVLAGARHDARRHQRRVVAGTSAVAATVLAGSVGAGVLLLHDEPPVTVVPGDGPPAEMTMPAVTAIRLVGHDGYDRVEIEYNAQVEYADMYPEHGPGPDSQVPESPACPLPDDLEDDAISYLPLASAVAPTADGLVPGISGLRVDGAAGGAAYIREVVPLCAVDGYTWLAAVIDDPDLIGRRIPGSPGTDPNTTLPDLDHVGMLGGSTCQGAPATILSDFWVWPPADDTPPSPEVCPPAGA